MEQTILIYPDPISVERVSYLINQKGIDPVIANIDLAQCQRDTLQK
jgi:hypothetical protein